MTIFKHRFETIEGYLHHRRPYLVVERAVEIQERQIVTEMTVQGEGFYAEGHFPGAAVLPGAIMQEFTTQSAGILLAAEHNPMQAYDTSDPVLNPYALGVLVRVLNARYRGFARPGDVLTASVTLEEQVENLFRFAGAVTRGEERLLRNEFQLANIESRKLTQPAKIRAN